MIWWKEKKLLEQLERERERLLDLLLQLSDPNGDSDLSLEQQREQHGKEIHRIKSELRKAGKKVVVIDKPEDLQKSWLDETKPQPSASAPAQQPAALTSDPTQKQLFTIAKQLFTTLSVIMTIVAGIAAIIQVRLQLLITPLPSTDRKLFGVFAWGIAGVSILGIALGISIMTLRRADIGRLKWLMIGIMLLGAIALGATLHPALLNQLSQLIKP